MTDSAGILAHIGVRGPAPFVAMALFTVGIGASFGAYRLFSRPPGPVRGVGSISLGVVAAACFLIATILPFLLGARPALGRPSTTARLQIVSPGIGEVFRGDPASVAVTLRLTGGKIVPISSLRLVPNEGHIHLYLDGSLVSMTTGLDAVVTASPGQHELTAEFVAVDHAPFQPRVRATVAFSVSG